MARSRKFLAAGAAGVAALALIGAGASATFTDSTHSLQQVQAGTLDVVLSAPGAANNWTKTITLPEFGPTTSTFKTDAIVVTIVNRGTIRANEVFMGLNIAPNSAANSHDAALVDQLSLCLWSPPSANGGTGMTVFNGKVSTLAAMAGGAGQAVAGYILGNTTDAYSAEFYAGSAATLCGTNTYGAGSYAADDLTDAAQGGVVHTDVKLAYKDLPN